MWKTELAVMACMIAANAVLAAYEFALASVSHARLAHLMREGRRGAKDALEMKRRIEGSLAVVQLGITLVAAVAAAVGGAGAAERLAPRLRESLDVSGPVGEGLALALVIVPLTAATIVCGELLPKVFALRNAERVLLLLSPFMRGAARALRPAVWALETAVKGLLALLGQGQPRRETPGGELQELRASTALARAARLIGQHEERIILGALQLRTRPLKDVMRPADAIHALPADATVEDALAAAHAHPHTRFPVARTAGDPQTILGYVSIKDLLAARDGANPGQSLERQARPILSFPAGLSLAIALETLLQARSHIALVRDPDGRVAGLVTLEDLLEELVGDMKDEWTGRKIPA